MSNPKKQHYISQCHIERFRDSDGKFWFFDFERPQKGVEHRSSASVFYKHQHNTFVTEAGQRDYSVEIELSKIEGEYREISNKAIAALEGGRVPALSSGERRFLSEYTLLQWKRSPDFEALSTPTDLVPGALKIMAREIEKESGVRLSAEEVSVLFSAQRTRDYSDPKFLAVFRKMSGDELASDKALLDLINGPTGQEARKAGAISARYSVVDEHQSFIEDMKSWWVLIPSKFSFVLGSQPIVSLSAEGKMNFHPLNGIVFPISSCVALVHGRKDLPYSVEVFGDMNTIRRLNTMLVHQSQSFGSRSSALTRSLSELRK